MGVSQAAKPLRYTESKSVIGQPVDLQNILVPQHPEGPDGALAVEGAPAGQLLQLRLRLNAAPQFRKAGGHSQRAEVIHCGGNGLLGQLLLGIPGGVQTPHLHAVLGKAGGVGFPTVGGPAAPHGGQGGPVGEVEPGAELVAQLVGGEVLGGCGRGCQPT